jgi:hypothetical protein
MFDGCAVGVSGLVMMVAWQGIEFFYHGWKYFVLLGLVLEATAESKNISFKEKTRRLKALEES